MSMFRAKKLDIGSFLNIKVIRDHTKRKVFAAHEPERQALRYIIQNTTLPARARAEAQLQLTQMHCYTRPTQIRGRCLLGGKGRGIFRDFRMSRYNFRMQALEGNLPGVRKASCYHVHESDEIRSIENPNNYFKFFISKNQRHNERQRFAMNEAIEKEVYARLESFGLKKTLLPLGTTFIDEPNVPIFVSSTIKARSRVVIIIGETYQDLGIIAHRVLGGPGGVNKGSMASVVGTLLCQPSSPTDHSQPGFILANTGQYIWHPSLKRCTTIVGSEGTPMPSAVHAGIKWYGKVGKDRVKGSENTKEHIKTIFESVVPAYVNGDASIDIIAVGDGADALVQYLDWSETWKKLTGRINCLAIIGGYHDVEELKCDAFRQFLREKARAYATCSEPLGLPISGPDGNPNTMTFTRLGCPLYSGGEPHFVETLLIHALPHLADWLREVTEAGKNNYRNPNMIVMYKDPEDVTRQFEPDWSKWQNAPLHDQPPTDFGSVDPKADISGEGKETDDDDEEKQAKLDKAVLDDVDEDERDQEIKDLEKMLMLMDKVEDETF
ncbi:Arb2 domain-containing protein [Seiridium cupressi]